VSAASARATVWRGGLLLWAETQQGRFAPWLAVLMGLGVLGYFAWPVEPPAWAGAAALALGIGASVVGWRTLEGRAAGLAALALATGFAAALWAAGRALPIEPVPRRAAVLTATVLQAEALASGTRAVLGDVRPGPDAPPLARSFRLRLRPADPATLAAGDRIEVRALLRPPLPPVYPGAWDMQRDAYFAGQGGSARALGDVAVLAHAEPGGLARWWQGLRERIGTRIRAALPGTNGAIAATLLTGEQAAIPESDRAAFRNSGLAHLLAVAGLHVGIVMAVAFAVARWLLTRAEWTALFWPCKAISACFALAAGGMYVLLTGAHVPTVRSFAMACLVTLGIAAGRRAVSMRGLGLAAAVILLVTPEAVLGVSFQMSFSAVAALIAGYEALRPALSLLQRGGRRMALQIASLALTSLLAGTASAPFAAYHFGQVQIYFIVANMVAVPIAAFVAMPAGLAALALMPFGFERVTLVPMGWGVGAILFVARTVSAWPAAVLRVPHLPGWGLGLVALGLAWVCLWRHWVRLLGIGLVAAGLLSPVVARPPDLVVSPDGRLAAVRDRALRTVPGHGSGFVLNSWRNYLFTGPPQPLGCDAAGCRITRAGATVLILPARTPLGDCAGLALVVTLSFTGACPAVPAIDGASAWRDGAHAVWLRRGAARIVSDRTERGARPWVAEHATLTDAPPDLPMAIAE